MNRNSINSTGRQFQAGFTPAGCYAAGMLVGAHAGTHARLQGMGEAARMIACPVSESQGSRAMWPVGKMVVARMMVGANSVDAVASVTGRKEAITKPGSWPAAGRDPIG